MSRFLIALGLFVLLNILLMRATIGLNASLHEDNRNEPYTQAFKESEKHLRIEWALSDFENQQNQIAPIVLLGSSLVLVPTALADATLFHRPVDTIKHHKSTLLSLLLNDRTGLAIDNFDFAVVGMMVSDAYLITKTILSGQNHPRLIIYGVGPRDFMDNTFPGPYTSEPYYLLKKQLAKRYGRQALLPFLEQNWALRLDYLLAQTLPIYGNKDEITGKIYGRLNHILESLANIFSKADHKNLYQRNFSAIAETNLAEFQKFGIGEALLFQPNLDDYYVGNRHVFQKLDEHRFHYQYLNTRIFNSQSKFFLKFLKTAADNQIKVLVVAMPTKVQSKSVLPASGFEVYKENIRNLTKSCGASFLDLDQAFYFNDQDFHDDIHLNALGGIKFMRALSNYLAESNLLKYITTDKSLDIASMNKQLTTIGKVASWWLTKAYFAGKKPPDIVVLGNSRLSPLQGADAYVYNRKIDLTGDHRSYTTEYDFKRVLHKNWKVLVGALPDAMVSDQYITSQALFKDKYKPRLVAIMLSPASFINSSRLSTISSEEFSFFSKYCPKQNLIESTYSKPLRMEDYEFKRMDSDYSKSTSPLIFDKPFRRLRPGEIVINSADGHFYKDNTEEYRASYKGSYNQQFALQLNYLDKLLKYLKQQNIAAVAIELPLTNPSHILLPEIFWNSYKRQVSSICYKNNADYWNVESLWDNSKSDFCDSEHLTLCGGLKLTRSIILATAYKFHLPMYTFDTNAGPLVPGKEQIYFRNSKAIANKKTLEIASK